MNPITNGKKRGSKRERLCLAHALSGLAKEMAGNFLHAAVTASEFKELC
jgi:hypothetical protein